MLTELLYGTLPFAGSSDREQLRLLVEALGLPPNPTPNPYPNPNPYPVDPVSWAEVLRGVPSGLGLGLGVDVLSDLMEQVFVWDPRLRPSAQDLLRHPLLA
jgi:serine/threonine protein kinase